MVLGKYALLAWDNKLTLLRRQLQTGKSAGADAYSGMIDCFSKIIRNEGFVPLALARPRRPPCEAVQVPKANLLPCIHAARPASTAESPRPS